ncbi:hypothetical protein KY335_05655, partial [Candidatus Woesearchaeota archaeon]|nr:hypothetical protein [Candidatus Woesearchaeota archaeon]
MAKNKPRALTLPRFNLRIPPKWQKPLMIILACILIIVFLVYLMPESGTTDCQTDRACFLQKAMRCEPAKFENMVGTTQLSYHVSKDCVLTKTITKLGEKEPNEVKSLFLGLSMKCEY